MRNFAKFAILMLPALLTGCSNAGQTRKPDTRPPQVAMRSVAVGGEWKIGDIRSCRFESDGSLDCSTIRSTPPPKTLPPDFFQLFKVQFPAAVQLARNQLYGCERVNSNTLNCDVLNPSPSASSSPATKAQ